MKRFALYALALLTIATTAAANTRDLERAAKRGNVPALQSMLDAGVPVDTRLDIGRTALLVATVNGRTQAMELLLRAGADIDAVDNNGSTALILAAEYGHLAAVKLLLARGADPTIKNHNGWTAVAMAKPDSSFRPALTWSKDQTEIYRVLSAAPRAQPRTTPSTAAATAAPASTPAASSEIVNALVFRPNANAELSARFKDAAIAAFTANGWTLAGSGAARVTAQQQGRDLLKVEMRLVGDTVLIGYHRGLHSNANEPLKALQGTLEAELQRAERKSP